MVLAVQTTPGDGGAIVELLEPGSDGRLGARRLRGAGGAPHAHAPEELYLSRFAPAHGFGVHVDVGDDACHTDGDAPKVVRDGDVVRIRSGHHPVVAAPGCTMYYLWALAGDAPAVD